MKNLVSMHVLQHLFDLLTLTDMFLLLDYTGNDI